MTLWGRSFEPTEQFIRYNTLYFWIYYIVISICDGSDKHLREPSLGSVLFRLTDLSVSLLPEVFENLVDSVDATHRGFSADPVDYDRPLERIEIMFRLGEDLVGSGG